MKIESKQEIQRKAPKCKNVPAKVQAQPQDNAPTHVVLPPPIPGKTGWSIVPW